MDGLHWQAGKQSGQESGEPLSFQCSPPSLFSPLDRIGVYEERVVVLPERTPQSYLLGAYIAHILLNRGMGVKFGFNDGDVEYDNRGSMVVIGNPIPMDKVEYAGYCGWSLHAVPQSEPIEVMKIFMNRYMPYRSLCSNPWGRLLLPSRVVPAMYHMKLTGHHGIDGIVGAANALGMPHPALRRRVREWIRGVLVSSAADQLAELVDPIVTKRQVSMALGVIESSILGYC